MIEKRFNDRCIASTGLRELFQAKLNTKPESFVGAILEYASAIATARPSSDGTVWTILEGQLRYQAEKYQVTLEEVVSHIFATDDPDIFLGRLQV